MDESPTLRGTWAGRVKEPSRGSLGHVKERPQRCWSYQVCALLACHTSVTSASCCSRLPGAAFLSEKRTGALKLRLGKHGNRTNVNREIMKEIISENTRCFTFVFGCFVRKVIGCLASVFHGKKHSRIYQMRQYCRIHDGLIHYLLVTGLTGRPVTQSMAMDCHFWVGIEIGSSRPRGKWWSALTRTQTSQV